MFGRVRLALLLVVLGSLAWSASASAVITTPFGPGTGVTCAPDAGDRLCGGIVESFDGAPIDVNLRLPAAPANPLDPDGPYPLVMVFHGWGGSKLGGATLDRWVNKGYAAFSMSDRGWGLSCGGTDSKRLTPACTGLGPTGSKGYNHLMDTRWEVRDAQYLAGLLVDNDVVIPDKIGSTGGSYGGGISMALAALNDRTMLGALSTETNGQLVPWESPDGTAMKLAAAAPQIPWTDLANSLVPNGATLDYAVDSTYDKRPFGVMKQSFDTALYGVGVAFSNFSPVGTDPSADVNGWYALLTAGEPYTGNPLAQQIADEVTEFHSSYYIDHSRPPSPLLISNGFTDDLFPVDEAVRFYNRTRNQYPGADISMFHYDYGHMRGQGEGKAADAALLRARQDAWFDYYLKGIGAKPSNQVETLTQTCPFTDPSVAYSAPTWAALAPGEVRFQQEDQAVIAPEAGSPAASQAYDPVAGGGACATADATDSPGVASYRLDPAPVGGYTLMGAPTVVADILNVSPNSQLTSRLIDVDPSGDGTLVARGTLRLEGGTEATREVFQLHPNGYHFAEGHIAKLELLPSDAPYVRKSNAQGPVTVSNLDFRLPVVETPGSPSVVTAPAPKVVPDGYALSSDYGPPSGGDSDGDGIPNSSDDCPNEAGPAQASPKNGCPLPDDDGDGVPNIDDTCPAQPGPAVNQGCPENPVDDDTDGDGVLNSQDACPTTPGAAANAGCPFPREIDADGDGIRDSEDGCPTQAGPAANAGCPVSSQQPPATDDCGNLQRGTRKGNRITGTAASDRIVGRAGNDRIKGREGGDCIFGGAGKDRINAGTGADTVEAGRHDDRVNARDNAADTINCGAGRDRVKADEADELVNCESAQRR